MCGPGHKRPGSQQEWGFPGRGRPLRSEVTREKPDVGREVKCTMCATCGCLTSKAPAPEDGTYKCVECDKAGKSEQATVKKGEPMPGCSACGSAKGHWVKV